MIPTLLLVSATWAQAPPTLPAGLVVLPEGSSVTIGTTVYPLSQKYWLLPDSHYRSAVVQAKKLGVCQPALDQCVESMLEWQERTYSALQTCSDQFGADKVLAGNLATQVQTLEARALVAESNLQRARRNSVVAWGITGGLVVGAVVGVATTP